MKLPRVGGEPVLPPARAHEERPLGGATARLPDRPEAEDARASGAGHRRADVLEVARANDGVLSAFDARTGAPRWAKLTGGPLLSAPAVSSGVVYRHSDDGFLYVLDAATGAERCRAEVGRNGAAPAFASSRVHLVSGTVLLALGTAAGERLWTREVGGEANRSTPAVVSGVVYTGTGRDGTVLAVNAKTGATVWAPDLSGGAPTDVASPVVGRASSTPAPRADCTR